MRSLIDAGAIVRADQPPLVRWTSNLAFYREIPYTRILAAAAASLWRWPAAWRTGVAETLDRFGSPPPCAALRPSADDRGYNSTGVVPISARFDQVGPHARSSRISSCSIA